MPAAATGSTSAAGRAVAWLKRGGGGGGGRSFQCSPVAAATRSAAAVATAEVAAAAAVAADGAKENRTYEHDQTQSACGNHFFSAARWPCWPPAVLAAGQQSFATPSGDGKPSAMPSSTATRAALRAILGANFRQLIPAEVSSATGLSRPGPRPLRSTRTATRGMDCGWTEGWTRRYRSRRRRPDGADTIGNGMRIVTREPSGNGLPGGWVALPRRMEDRQQRRTGGRTHTGRPGRTRSQARSGACWPMPQPKGPQAGRYHGCSYRILTGQGPDAPGGRSSYIADGRDQRLRAGCPADQLWQETAS